MASLTWEIMFVLPMFDLVTNGHIRLADVMVVAKICPLPPVDCSV